MTQHLSAALSPSAHQDTFCRDNLPPLDQWPVLDLGSLDYADRLNCATELLDATIDRLGADRPCLRSPDGTVWTYGELRAHANRIAAVLVDDLGLVPGNRVLLRGFNEPWLVACWFAVLKAGGVAVTTMPLLRAGELATMAEMCRPDRGAVRRPADRGPGEGGDPRPPDGDVRLDRARRPDRPGRGEAGRVRRRRHRRRRRRPAGLHLRHHRPPQGDHALPPRRARHRRHVLGARAAPRTRRRLHRLPADRLHLRPRRPGGLPAARRAPAPCCWSGRRPTSSPTPSRGTGSRSCSPRRPPTRRSSPRAPARSSPACAAPCPPARRSRRRCGRPCTTPIGLRIIDGIGATEMLHIFISAADDDIRPGSTGRAVPGYTAAVLDDDGQPVPDGTPGHLAVRGPTGCRYLGGDRQEIYVRHGWNFTGDTYVARRRRLLPLPGPHRRHDRLRRLQHRRPRGRAGAARPSRRRRLRRRRCARRRARHDRQGVRRPQPGPRGGT